MKRHIFLSVFVISLLIAGSVSADVMQERMYLMQALHQLDAAQPLILAAQKAQPKNSRIRFHYVRYQDNEGHWHNGLLEDLQAIKKGIEAHLTPTAIEPRVLPPIKGDYQQTTMTVNLP